jgi:DNA-binding NarL/FixJ family response regulator
MGPTRKPRLTPRETEVLTLVAQGKKTREVAEILRVTKRTVEVHVCSITTKLDASNRTHAVALAVQNHLLEI